MRDAPVGRAPGAPEDRHDLPEEGWRDHRDMVRADHDQSEARNARRIAAEDWLRDTALPEDHR